MTSLVSSTGGELVTTNSDSDIVYLIIKNFLNLSLKQLVKDIKLRQHRFYVLFSCLKYDLFSFARLQHNCGALLPHTLSVPCCHSRLNLPVEVLKALASAAIGGIANCS